MFGEENRRDPERTFEREKSKRTGAKGYIITNRSNRLECELYDLGWIKYYWCPNVYKPSDDTLLLIEIIDNLMRDQGRVLEIGTGTGIVLAYLLKNNENLTGVGVDVNPLAAYNTYITLHINNIDHRAEVLNCESVTCIKEGIMFDIVLYNPPYLIGEPNTRNYNDIAELGGSEGIDNLIEVLEKMLQNRNVNHKTEIYVIVPEPPPLERTSRRLRKLGFNVEILKSKQFFYENIHGIKLELNQC